MLSPRSNLYTRRQHSSSAAPAPVSTTSLQSQSSSRRKDDGTSGNAIIPSSISTCTHSLFTIPDPWAMSHSNGYMAKRNGSQRSQPRSMGSPLKTSTTVSENRPLDPANAVEIPVKARKHGDATTNYTHKSRYSAESHARRRYPSIWQQRQEKHCPDAIPPSVAALLAVTNIPLPCRRSSLRRRRSRESSMSAESRMTWDSIAPRSQMSEKELSEELGSLPSSRSPLDVLLSPPDELADEDVFVDDSATSDSACASPFSTRPGSFDSLPSLGDSFGTSTTFSVDSPLSPRVSKSRTPRRSLEPLSSPSGQEPHHPLSVNPDVVEDQDFPVYKPASDATKKDGLAGLMPFKTAFKSNLTASLRALRSAARTLSTFTASSIPADDLLTRSILTIDPRMPFTDERRPPVLDEEPSEAMRRYLNPSSTPRMELRTGGPLTRSYTASIQMQTYKVRRATSVSSSTDRAAAPEHQGPHSQHAAAQILPATPRQREIRENSDFLRIAVMEHLMRKTGKLDDQREGHARWILAPRKLSMKSYEIGPEGVPARWTSTLADDV